MAKTPTHLATQGVVLIPIKDIKADKKWNVRLHVDGIDDLAKDIKERGLISPITVRAISDKKYSVIVGFRRFYAMQALGFTDVPATVFTGDEQSALLLNLSENTQRKDLSTYEIALRCALLRDAPHNMPSVSIATTIGKSKTYVENLIRSLTKLDEPILKAWSDPNHAAHALCSTNELNRLAAMEPDLQMAAWDELRGHKPKEATENAATAATDAPDKPKPIKRPSLSKLAEAIEVVKASDALEHIEKSCTISALRWAMGQVQSLRKGGLIIYNPSNKPEKEEPAS